MSDYQPLTAEEMHEALIAAAKAKRFALARRAYQQHISEPVKYPTFTAETFYNHKLEFAQLLAQRGVIKRFVVDAENEKVFKLLCCYFTGDKRFEKDGYSLSKGILLTGGVGCGKTTIMKIFTQNQIQSYFLDSCVEIAMEFTSEGYDDMLKYYAEPMQPSATANEFGHTTFVQCFDDLGAENATSYYGNTEHIMEKILMVRYSKGILTHATTNLSVEEIADKYKSPRLVSRLNEMFNLIVLPGEDRRTLKLAS